jgi:hypothetical protein
MIRLPVFAIALVLLGQIGLHAQNPPPARLQIKILDGEGALNNIKQQTAREPIVQVEDENHKPVAGALVTFALPPSGPSGTFANGLTTFSERTDATGTLPEKTGLIPNKIVGKYQIKVEVKYHNLSAQTSINQSNFMGANVTAAHTAAHAFPLKAVLIVAAVGAAAVATGVALQSGGSQSATITPGTGTVGAPSAGHRHR